MADVEVQMQYTAERKVRKVKKTTTTKRRESSDQGEVTITEINEKENQLPDQGCVPALQSMYHVACICPCRLAPA
ncbi:unnamed protein product [Nezara viridula]|uniref:Uncharacterized protein n=1 Tax=Nezara viridula TaxID=85310 RepID=A0A9P0HH00_NEZVI|nr:unnamed protein product [Nezara viridula]